MTTTQELILKAVDAVVWRTAREIAGKANIKGRVSHGLGVLLLKGLIDVKLLSLRPVVYGYRLAKGKEVARGHEAQAS